MADDVNADIADALNIISSTTERSSNMKKELKNTIYETVSTLRKLFAKLKNIDDSKSKKISELETLVATTKAELERAISKTEKGQEIPPSDPRLDKTLPVEWTVAPPGVGISKLYATGQAQARLYSEVLGGKPRQDNYKLTVSSKDCQSPDAIKGVLKAAVNPTIIKVGIKSIKSLRNGRVQIETGSKEEVEKLTKDINEKCGQSLQAQVHRRRNPRLVIYNIPEDISTNNAEEIILGQNP
jgi:hypothetical protein